MQRLISIVNPIFHLDGAIIYFLFFGLEGTVGLDRGTRAESEQTPRAEFETWGINPIFFNHFSHALQWASNLGQLVPN